MKVSLSKGAVLLFHLISGSVNLKFTVSYPKL